MGLELLGELGIPGKPQPSRSQLSLAVSFSAFRIESRQLLAFSGAVQAVLYGHACSLEHRALLSLQAGARLVSLPPTPGVEPRSVMPEASPISSTLVNEIIVRLLGCRHIEPSNQNKPLRLPRDKRRLVSKSLIVG